MPKKTTRATNKQPQPAFRGFLNIDLSDEDRSIIKSTVYDDAEWHGDIHKWIDNGFKFTFGYDNYNHCFSVIGARNDREHLDAGILLTGRGSTPSKAFKQWVYIQTRLVGDATWTELLDTGVTQEIDD